MHTLNFSLAPGSGPKYSKPLHLVDTLKFFRILFKFETIWNVVYCEYVMPISKWIAQYIFKLLNIFPKILSLCIFTLFHRVLISLSVFILLSVSEMKMVFWSGENYFLTLANMWVNLISCDPPELPHLEIGSWEDSWKKWSECFLEMCA